MKILGSCECCGILCYIFLRVERALVLCNFVIYFSLCGWRSGIVLFFPASGNHSIIVEICFFLFFFAWNALWYYKNWCYIFLCVEHILVMCNSVFYFSACGKRSGIMEFCLNIFGCGTRSSIVEFHVLFFFVWNTLWYCGICVIFFAFQRNAL